MDLLLFICAWNCVKLKFCRFLYGSSLSQCSLNAILVGLCSAWGLKSIPSTLFFYFIFSIFSLIFLFLSSIVYFRIFLMLRFCLECLFPLTIKIIADNSLISRLALRTYAYLKETLASQLLGLPFHLLNCPSLPLLSGLWFGRCPWCLFIQHGAALTLCGRGQWIVLDTEH